MKDSADMKTDISVFFAGFLIAVILLVVGGGSEGIGTAANWCKPILIPEADLVRPDP